MIVENVVFCDDDAKPEDDETLKRYRTFKNKRFENFKFTAQNSKCGN